MKFYDVWDPDATTPHMSVAWSWAYVEAETGKGADALERRPKLAAAIKAARKIKGPVVVAKLDRLMTLEGGEEPSGKAARICLEVLAERRAAPPR